MSDTTDQTPERDYLDIEVDFSGAMDPIISITTLMIGYGNVFQLSDKDIARTGGILHDAAKEMRNHFDELLEAYQAERKAREVQEVQS